MFYSPIQPVKLTAKNLTANQNEPLQMRGTFHECMIKLAKWCLEQDVSDSLNIYIQPNQINRHL